MGNQPILANLSRARQVMARRGLDGLVAQLSINVYYLSGYWGMLMSAERFDAAFLAVLPRREDLPAVLVMPTIELRRLVSEGGTWMPEIVAYSSPLDDESEGLQTDGKPYDGWPVQPGAALTSREQAWTDITRRHRDRVAADARVALVRALRLAGLESGRLGTDDPRIEGWAQAGGLAGVSCAVDANVFNEIRRVKTPAELELLRAAARINEASLRAAAVGAVRRAGFPEFVYATPHGVGLKHTDDPKPPGRLPGAQWDTPLEPGMVLNVDLPFTEIGWGSVHIEDTVHVTADGFETLTSPDFGILCRP
jgi:Xaa-Pro aminopeptidase